MCNSQSCQRRGCLKLVPENRTDGFCSAQCKKNEFALRLSNMRMVYSELPSVKSEPKEKKVCKNTGCNNVIKKRGRRAKYCSIACRSEDRKKYKVIPCEQCQTPFQSGRFNKRFCSRACHRAFIRVERFCANSECGKLLDCSGGIKKYCGKSCYDTDRNKGVVRYHECQNSTCHKALTEAQTKNGQKYCGNSCYVQAKKQIQGDGIGKITLRKERQWKYPRRFIKTGRGWILLARYTWEQQNGPLPANHYISCKDGNTFNDEDINNLEAIHISQALKNKISSAEPEAEVENSKEFFEFTQYML
jgi:hypothetical protein